MKKTIATAAISAAILLAPAGVAGQGEFEGMVKLRMTGAASDQSLQITQYVKGTMIRQEFDMGGMEMFSLLDTDAGTITMIMPAQRMYMQMGAPGMRGASGGERDAAPPELTATGRKETVAGHECEYYTMTSPDGQKIDMCVAKGLGFGWLGGGGGMGGSGMGGRGMGGGMGGGGGDMDARWLKAWREQFKDGFFPLKITGGTGDRAFTMEVTEVQRSSVADDLMRIPEGYTGMNMGRRGGGGGRG